jgi:hypothetical protein
MPGSIPRRSNCGEGIYPRWDAKRPLFLSTRHIRQTKYPGLGTAAQPNGDKSPRHKSPAKLFRDTFE